MPVINNQRPGVYSRYDVSSAYAAPRSAAYAAVVARASGGERGVLHSFTSLSALAEAFPPDTGGAALRGCVQILLQSGVSKVYAVAVGPEGYAAALVKTEQLENVGAVVCDAVEAADLAAVKLSAQVSAEALRERVAFCGAAADGAAQAAETLNCERVVLCCPAVKQVGGGSAHAAYGAAALAGKVLAQGDAAYSFSGEALATVEQPETLGESEIQALLAAGVSVLEQSGGAVECVRALTTRTKTGGETDYALRGLNAILCIDDVMRAVRAALKAVLRGGRASGRSLEAIRSQAAVVLADKKSDGVIERYEAPLARIHAEDPTVCVVELAFHVAHVVSQIHVSAHIQV